jgi:hypothetical protein
VELTQFNENVDLARTRQNFKHSQQIAEVCSVALYCSWQEIQSYEDGLSWHIDPLFTKISQYMCKWIRSWSRQGTDRQTYRQTCPLAKVYPCYGHSVLGRSMHCLSLLTIFGVVNLFRYAHLRPGLSPAMKQYLTDSAAGERMCRTS